ncbi:MAG TPA: DUF4340 domain-containing protein [Kofleriaceae bacterium]|nr:DUF4340 domain-containing protein [Kofleriaceae bacterium]
MWLRLALVAAVAIACGDDDVVRGDDDAGPAEVQAPPPPVSKPSATAIAALKKVAEPRALLFFPPGPVADQVLGYLTDLGDKAGAPFEVREIDRLIDVEQAKRFRVTRDGVVVLISGERFESIAISLAGAELAGDLARLDRQVARGLERLARGRRAVALVMQQAAGAGRFRRLGQALAALELEATAVVPGADVPAGALAIAVVAGAGPARPAMESVDRHLAAGGAALIAIEPRKGASLGRVGDRLGLRLVRGAVGKARAAGGSRVLSIGPLEVPGRPTAARVESGRARAIVVAGAGWLSDEGLAAGGGAVLIDAVGWLAGAEAMIPEAAGDDAPATGDQLTSYPLRTRAVAGTHGALWKVAEGGVQGLRFETRGRVVLLERRAGGVLWGRVERPSPDGAGAQVREFPLAPEAKDLFSALAEPVPLRAVGPLDATTRARYALDDGTLSVDLAGGATHTVEVGSRVMGSGDRYAADPRGRTVVILPASLIDPIDQTDRIALRKVLDIDARQLSRLVVAKGGTTREAVKAADGGWKVTGGGSEEAFLAEEIARAAFLLRPTEFAAADKAKEMTDAGRVTLTAGAAAPFDLELLARGDEFWVRTALTQGLLGRVSAGSARRIAQAIDELVTAAR